MSLAASGVQCMEEMQATDTSVLVTRLDCATVYGHQHRLLGNLNCAQVREVLVPSQTQRTSRIDNALFAAGIQFCATALRWYGPRASRTLNEDHKTVCKYSFETQHNGKMAGLLKSTVEALPAYRAMHGDCDVPSDLVTPASQGDEANTFVPWETQVEALEVYRRCIGRFEEMTDVHVVPRNAKIWPRAARGVLLVSIIPWLRSQLYVLDDDICRRVHILEPHTNLPHWSILMSYLNAYRRIHSHCRVPIDYVVSPGKTMKSMGTP
ncbi:hypothetical protein SDRG_16076 [Saprolegnia diclina VS20]|uniref:Uncharacterized protein n=1 Tax=Saprolegnia diclina (strain VS20) TaxID=1156394 RepID=T0R984_SAPDV|nr:hypothetical protein SDRG_16076 [Saprolegnia diclina VS20]EQC26057.1 hypothetical protein SDRG_16076 [Saprolegnia diclina VS20]|eukprot:XP_008620494.1 hypothetical protein SDRG_16076 [Saprolegnia diclina VS20]